MGVNLTPIAVRHSVALDALRGRSIAIDGNLELYQFLSIMRAQDGTPLQDREGRTTSHLNGLVFRTIRLIAEYDIHPVFVFDGTPPDLKRAEIERRRYIRDRSEREHAAALAAGDYGTAWSKVVMTSRLTREMVDEAKTLLRLLGIPWVQAPSEGEAQAAFLARRGDVWAAGSKDYDSLLFGAPRLVRFLAVGGKEFLPSRGRFRRVPPEILDLEENLHTLGLTREQLIDTAILVGTDFNDGIKGIGPKTAVNRIARWGRLEGAPPDLRARLPESLDAIRAFFLHPPVDAAQIPRETPVDEEGVLRFLCGERDFSPDRVRKALARLRNRSLRRTSLEDFRP